MWFPSVCRNMYVPIALTKWMSVILLFLCTFEKLNAFSHDFVVVGFFLALFFGWHVPYLCLYRLLNSFFFSFFICLWLIVWNGWSVGKIAVKFFYLILSFKLYGFVVWCLFYGALDLICTFTCISKFFILWTSLLFYNWRRLIHLRKSFIVRLHTIHSVRSAQVYNFTEIYSNEKINLISFYCPVNRYVHMYIGKVMIWFVEWELNRVFYWPPFMCEMSVGIFYASLLIQSISNLTFSFRE